MNSATAHHTITVPANPGLQLLDVVTLTDSPAPIGTNISTNARIAALEVQYDAQQARFDLTMTLEHP